jgi:hypothetical protein
VWWHGADLARFTAQWQRDRVELAAASRALERAARGLRSQVDEQRRASDASAAPTVGVAAGDATHAAPRHAALVASLASAPRGSLLTDLQVDERRWRALVERETIDVDGGARNVRYFDVPPVPAGGVLVVDLFIPFAASGFPVVLRGDNRGHVDPLRGKLDPTDSRLLLVIDREAGRASVGLSASTLQWPAATTEKPRPIALGGAGGVRQNRVDVAIGDRELRIGFDVLNSITPVGSADGTLTFEQGAGGALRLRAHEGDGYPSIGAYHYTAAGDTTVLLQHDSEPFTHALPWWPDGVRLPFEPGEVARHLPDWRGTIDAGLPMWPIPVDLPGPYELPIELPWSPGDAPPMVSGPWPLWIDGLFEDLGGPPEAIAAGPRLAVEAAEAAAEAAVEVGRDVGRAAADLFSGLLD